MTITVGQRDAFYTLCLSIQLKIPVFLWGPPGVGKTYTIAKISERLNIPFVKLIPSYREPVDFLGYPFPEGEIYTYLPPKWVKRVRELGRVILFLDELSTAPPQVQNAAFRLVSERVFGDDEPLPSEVSIVAAGNPTKYAWSAFNLTPPLANRFVHVDWVGESFSPVDLYKILRGAGLPDEIPLIPFDRYEQEYPLIFDFVFSFLIGVEGDGLLRPPVVGRHEEVRGFPTPRSWVEFCIPLLTAWKVTNLPISTFFTIVKGCVGEELAHSLTSYYLSVKDLSITLDDLASGRKSLPTKFDQLFFTVSSLLSQISIQNNPLGYNILLRELVKIGESLPDDILLLLYWKIEEWKGKINFVPTEMTEEGRWRELVRRRWVGR